MARAVATIGESLFFHEAAALGREKATGARDNPLLWQ